MSSLIILIILTISVFVTFVVYAYNDFKRLRQKEVLLSKKEAVIAVNTEGQLVEIIKFRDTFRVDEILMYDRKKSSKHQLAHSHTQSSVYGPSFQQCELYPFDNNYETYG